MRSVLLFLACIGIVFSKDSLIDDYKTKGFPAKISVLVVDQDNAPVSNAIVEFVFTFYPSESTTSIQTLTDETGLASGEAYTNDGIVIHIQKDGYYYSSTEYKV